MEFKGTKGKWYIDSFDDITTDDHCNDIVCVKPEDWIESMKKWDANALLISKAPEMLNMLKRVGEQAHLLGCITPDTHKEIIQLIKEATKLKQQS